VSLWLPDVLRRSPLHLARIWPGRRGLRGADCPATSGHRCSELATLSPSLGVVSVIHLAGHVAHCRVAELAAATRLGPCQTSSIPARTLISHTGFLNRRARLRFVHTPRTPAPTRARRLAPSPAVRGYRCTFQDRRARLRWRVTRVSPQPHQAGPERSAERGGHWWPGLYTLR
jgi:hypothetical protein